MMNMASQIGCSVGSATSSRLLWDDSENGNICLFDMSLRIDGLQLSAIECGPMRALIMFSKYLDVKQLGTRATSRG